ncbi:LEM domain-containing protein 1 isoform X3 [Anguilla anguilla]|uniref:LEM domain-containing protein 1 isoform X3 n=1 Tax=Anguilla anguilla TaxID=7936 RepID=UPI0015B04A2C|nr:LEM domain-containing protein 1 isoform X3 [Anguilla anguilla]
MPVFAQDPAQFSKQRLKLELVANNVDLPPGESKKQVYLDLYMKYVSKKGAADFSSDEEDHVQGNNVEDPSVQEEAEEAERQEQEADEMDVTQLTDDELKAQLLQFGVKAGPIVASTRALYERKLQRLLDPAALPDQNGTNEADQYSDSEEDEEEEDNPGGECEDPGPEPVAVAVVTGSRRGQLGSKQVGRHSQDDENHYYPQCFIPSSRMRVKCGSPLVCIPLWDPDPRGDPSACAERPVVPGTPVPDFLTEMFPDADRTPTGISATRRRPIKGAAGRPVRYKYPDLPLSPASLERRELQRRLVPVWVQVLVFLGVAGLLYLVYGAMETGLENPFAALLENLSQGAELAEEEPPPLPEPQDVPTNLLAEEY